VSIKSVHITNYYHKNSGGISTSYNNLLAAAERHQRFVTLIVPGETETVEIINDYAKIYYIPAKQSPIFDKRYRVIMPWQYLPGDSLMRKIIIDAQPDMIEVTDKYSLSMIGAMVRRDKFREIGRPMLVHFSCERMDDNIASFLSKGKIAKWFAKRLIGNYNFPSFDFHIANSIYTAQEFYEAVEKKHNPNRSEKFLNWCWRFFRSSQIPADERIYVCPRGVDAKTFNPTRKSDEVKREMRTRAKIPENSIVLLYAGRISPEKNIGLLIETMEILAKDGSQDYRLLVAGAGPQSEFLQAETDKLFPGKIVQLGHLDKETLANYYASADIFVHPNPHEPFGIAPLEAMASGVPTLAPKAGGILSYATNENAWLVQPQAEKFAEAVREIVGNPELRARKTQNAVQTALDNTREKSTDNLFATYDKMYEDFQKRKKQFTENVQIEDFNYADLTK
jgi:glycosyltransferase involved in cell wall biosynthesis